MDAMFKQKMENQAEWYGKSAHWMDGMNEWNQMGTMKGFE